MTFPSLLHGKEYEIVRMLILSCTCLLIFRHLAICDCFCTSNKFRLWCLNINKFTYYDNWNDYCDYYDPGLDSWAIGVGVCGCISSSSGDRSCRNRKTSYGSSTLKKRVEIVGLSLRVICCGLSISVDWSICYNWSWGNAIDRNSSIIFIYCITNEF